VRVYELLEEGGLAPGTATLEIGPGPGSATRHLLERGASPLVAVEPDERLARHLESWLRESGANATVHGCAFEDAALEPASFDLVVSATAFHWVEQRTALEKVASLLRPRGLFSAWWMIFGDPERRDPFHEATSGLLQRETGDCAARQLPFALQTGERCADLAAAGLREIDFHAIRETRAFTSEEIRGLYATFSSVARLSEAPRERLLDELVRVAEQEFGGRVERPLVTAFYSARRPGSRVRAEEE
jgi:SAM-dependent methyltransferase